LNLGQDAATKAKHRSKRTRVYLLYGGFFGGIKARASTEKYQTLEMLMGGEVTPQHGDRKASEYATHFVLEKIAIQS
jgi:hypothetical protein